MYICDSPPGSRTQLNLLTEKSCTYLSRDVPLPVIVFEFEFSMSYLFSADMQFFVVYVVFHSGYATFLWQISNFVFVFQIKQFLPGHMVHTFVVNDRTAVKIAYLLSKNYMSA